MHFPGIRTRRKKKYFESSSWALKSIFFELIIIKTSLRERSLFIFLSGADRRSDVTAKYVIVVPIYSISGKTRRIIYGEDVGVLNLVLSSVTNFV